VSTPFSSHHQLNRKSSSDSSKKESKNNSSHSSSVPPPPPPNTAKPLPNPLSSNSIPSQARSSSPASSAPSTPDRRHSGDSGSLTPPIVVVSPDSSNSNARGPHAGVGSERGLDGGNATPPRNTTLNRLRAGPKDTIPIVGKPPRKQRSSRFVVTEKVEIERLPPFMGLLSPTHSSLDSSLHSQQKLLRPNVLLCLSKSFTNVVFFSILTTPAPISRASKSRPKPFTKCSSTSPPNAASSLKTYTPRWSTWYVSSCFHSCLF